MSKKDSEELVTIKVKTTQKDAILEIQGLLQFRDHKHYSIDQIIAWLLEKAPEIEIPLSDRLRLSEEKPEKKRQSSRI